MKVIHIESGLGNQMLSYCEYLAIKKANPNDQILVETAIYDIPQCNEVICQWNGYELNRIFNINPVNIKDVMSDEKWKLFMEEIEKSEFWKHNWNWPVYFQNAFNKIGLNLENTRGDFEAQGATINVNSCCEKKSIKSCLSKYDWYLYLQDKWRTYLYSKMSKKCNFENVHFIKSDNNILAGQRLSFKYVGSGIEKIEKEIRKTFVFPEITDLKNKETLKLIRGCNSVAIHARRGDMLGMNYALYRFGYFKRAVKYIRSKVDNPVFFIFCDPDSIEWSKQNSDILGLNIKLDKIYFVDWNQGADSFRDMQMMAQCKHQIITNSSFGWWASWFNTNPNKITCSHNPIINTIYHF